MSLNQIVKIDVRMEGKKLITDSRNIAEVFGKRHDHILRDIENIKKDAPNFGEMFCECLLPDSYGRQQKAYLMNRDGFSLLAMGFTGTDAMSWKLKYINAFNEMEKALNSPEQIFARAVLLANDTINNLNMQVEEMKPKADFYDAVASSKDVIDIGQVAKVLAVPGIGRNKLFTILKDRRILMSSNVPYQKYIDRGYFKLIEQKFTTPDGETRVSVKTVVYQKGVDAIRKLLETV